MEKLDTYHFHESLDRAIMIIEIIENSLVKHPVYDCAPEHIQEKIKVAQDLLMDYYQYCGEQQDKILEEKDD